MRKRFLKVHVDMLEQLLRLDWEQIYILDLIPITQNGFIIQKFKKSSETLQEKLGKRVRLKLSIQIICSFIHFLYR